MNRSRNAGSDAAARDGSRIFSATSRSSRSSRARKTTAIPPEPTRASRRYPASIEPGLNRAGYGGKLSPNASPKNSRCPGSVRFQGHDGAALLNTLLSVGICFAASATEEMGAFGGVAGHGRGAFEFGAGLRVPAEPGEQVAADARQ